MKFESASEKAIFSTIRIETRSSQEDFIVGTAFIYEFSTEDNTYPFLVTTRNLIENAKEGRITLIQGQNREPIIGKGYTLDIENFSKLWFCHPDDELNIAVTPFVPFVKHVENAGVNIYFDSLNERTLYPREEYKNIKLGEDLMYLGYPKSCWDEKHLLPVFRQGMLSLPYELHYHGKPQGLVDTTVVEGASGSPVFLRSKYTEHGIEGSLLGVLSTIPVKIGDQDDYTNIEESLQESSMGVVIKISVALEAITAYLQEKGFI